LFEVGYSTTLEEVGWSNSIPSLCEAWRTTEGVFATFAVLWVEVGSVMVGRCNCSLRTFARDYQRETMHT
jgi:hypothetical protein